MVPALAVAIFYSKIVPAAQIEAPLLFGQPLLQKMLVALLHPGIPARDVFLHPVGRAAWVGLFATALNLLPAGQLDGGHVIYALASKHHRRISAIVAACMMSLGLTALVAHRLGWPPGLFWEGWLMWGALLLLFGFRHPMLLDRWQPLDRKRRVWAGIALVIFLLCFMLVPLAEQQP